MRNPLFVAALLASAFAAPQASAQAWPQKPLHVIIAAAPGGGSDTLARAMAEPLGKSLGQPVVIENRSGADGFIAGELCAKAAPDGYTLCGTSSGLVVWNMVVHRNPPYDSMRDFTPVVQVGFFDSVLVVNPALPVRSLKELFDYARANPNKVNWGHNGSNDTSYWYEEWLRHARNVPFFSVPYKTQPQVNLAVITGETQVGYNAVFNLAPQIKSGKLRPLATNATKRIAWLPDVPTFDEEGIKLPLRNWLGYHYPSGVPREIVQRMNTEMRRVMETPDYRTRVIDRLGITAELGTPEEFDAFVRAQLRDVREVFATIAFKPK
jgi:tripartite-type tricarboxylate transporter receptor subunit TctC